jgi:hypothetical protein
MRYAEVNSTAFVMLNSLYHLQGLDDPSSCEYIEETAIAHFKKYCKSELLLKCYVKLAEHYANCNAAKSITYYKEAFALSEMLRKGDVSCLSKVF